MHQGVGDVGARCFHCLLLKTGFRAALLDPEPELPGTGLAEPLRSLSLFVVLSWDQEVL